MKSTQSDGANLARDAADLADRAKAEVRDAGERLADMADRAQSEAMSAGATISALVLDEIDRRGAALADGLQQIAETVRDTAGGTGDLPRVVQQAVGMIDDVSDRLRDGSVRDIGDRIARFGRENPGTLVLAALATGVLAGRFLIAKGKDAPAADDGYTAERRAPAQAETADSRLQAEGAYDRP